MLFLEVPKDLLEDILAVSKTPEYFTSALILEGHLGRTLTSRVNLNGLFGCHI